MDDAYTPGARRLLDRAADLARDAGAGTIAPDHLLLALLEEEDGIASDLLGRHGLISDALLASLRPPTNLEAASPSSEAPIPPIGSELRAILNEATTRARRYDRSRAVSSASILAALIDGPVPHSDRLASAGLDVPALLAGLGQHDEPAVDPLPLPDEISPLELISPSEVVDLGRILDASANRAREGLRVAEDYVRFALDDPMLTRRLKEVRHRLDACVRNLDPDLLIGSRDASGDVGTHVTTAQDRTRENPRAVLSANFKRATEALRSLEEFTKLLDVWVSGRFEVLRYDVYTLEKLALTAMSARSMFDDVRLYVLVGGESTLGELTWIVGEALAGGAQAIQFRDKHLSDRELLSRAREVRILTARARARFILNDRPDLARLAGADGVHLGQDDMTVRDARRVIGPRAAIGVSTHEVPQIERAVLDGAGYLGVGPVFPGSTKDFDAFAGLEFVRKAAEATKLPWFAIGGITPENVAEVIDAGASRVAVAGGVARAERPRAAAKALRAALDSAAS